MLHVAVAGIYSSAVPHLGDSTTNLLRHALAGTGASLIAAFALCPEHVQAAAFAGAMSALLVDLDRYELPQGRRTPLGHSLMAWAMWSYVASMVLVTLAFSELITSPIAVPVATGIAVGYGTHLAIDAFSSEGIYTFPNKKFPALAPLPDGSTRQWPGWSVARSSFAKLSAPSSEPRRAPQKP